MLPGAIKASISNKFLDESNGRLISRDSVVAFAGRLFAKLQLGLSCNNLSCSNNGLCHLK
jgi:hypothetical protein